MKINEAQGRVCVDEHLEMDAMEMVKPITINNN